MTLNPFAQQTPDSVESTLQGASCSVLLFPPRGAAHCLAVGRSDALVVLYDVETRGLARVLEGHVKAVTGLAWSHNGRFLVSGSADCTVVRWDLAPGNARHSVRFETPVTSVDVAASDSNLLLVTLETQQSVLVSLSLRRRRRGRRRAAAQGDSEMHEVNGAVKSERASAEEPPVPSGAAAEEDEVEVQHIERRWVVGLSPEEEESGNDGNITMSLFHPSGTHLLAGTSRGSLLLFALSPDGERGGRLVQRVHLGAITPVREMAFDGAGRNLVVNSSDRAIRVYSVLSGRAAAAAAGEEAEENPVRLADAASYKFQDLVNRTPWNGIGFSGDSDYVYAGAAHIAAHNIYIWDRGAGALDKILEGPKEPLVDVDWHPTRPLLASASAGGAVNIWFTPTAEIWSAYAPGFEELEENVEYEEREDEFDVENEDEASRRKADEEEALVDILTPPLAAGGGAVVHRKDVTGHGGAPDPQLWGLPRDVRRELEHGLPEGQEPWEYFEVDDEDDEPEFHLPVDLDVDYGALLDEGEE